MIDAAYCGDAPSAAVANQHGQAVTAYQTSSLVGQLVCRIGRFPVLVYAEGKSLDLLGQPNRLFDLRDLPVQFVFQRDRANCLGEVEQFFAGNRGRFGGQIDRQHALRAVRIFQRGSQHRTGNDSVWLGRKTRSLSAGHQCCVANRFCFHSAMPRLVVRRFQPELAERRELVTGNGKPHSGSHRANCDRRSLQQLGIE